VRAVVDQWVRAEPACRVALEARIIPTDGGFYLVVLDERGQVRERIVPDATSAAVLIASWAADDSILLSAPSGRHLALPPGPVLVPAPSPTRQPPASPVLDIPPPAPVLIAPVVPPAPAALAIAPAPIAVALVPTAPPMAVVATTARAPAADGPIIHRISLTAFSDLKRDQENGRVSGLRMELDLWKNGTWSGGMALSTGIARGPVNEDSDRRWSLESTAIAYGGPSIELGRLQLAPALGFGVAHSYVHDRRYTWYQRTAWQAAVLAEASLRVSVRVWRGAAIAVTPRWSAVSRPTWGNLYPLDERNHTIVTIGGGLQWAW